MADERQDLTSGDPLGADAPLPAAPSSGGAVGAYGGGPVPPGVTSPAPRPPRPTFQPGELAGWGRRAAAAFIDGAILLGITLAVLGGAGAGFFADGDLGIGELIVGALLTVLLFAGLALLYAPIVMAQTNGKTLGKALAGCRVVRADGKKVTFGYAVLREVLVKGLLFGVAGAVTGGLAYLAEYLWPLWDGQNRALHDYVVDSRVVRS